jgi:predicted transcriptional regulator
MPADRTHREDSKGATAGRRQVSVRDEVRELLEATPDERLEDVRTYLEHLRAADAAWINWHEQYGGAATDARTRAAVAEADPSESIPHESVGAWLRSWGTDAELPPPTTKM